MSNGYLHLVNCILDTLDILCGSDDQGAILKYYGYAISNYKKKVSLGENKRTTSVQYYKDPRKSTDFNSAKSFYKEVRP